MTEKAGSCIQGIERAMTKMLDISTAHIPKHTADALGDATSDKKPELFDAISYVHYHEYGWIIHTSEVEAVRSQHPELAALIELAKRNGAEHLKLDCDAPKIEGLASFEW